MTIDEAAKTLGDDYRSAGEGEKVIAIHLFGIRHANEIDGMPLTDLVIRAGLPKSFGTEVRKGINLARFVVMR